MQPKISVIIPVYKAEKYLHRCVDSILAQTFTDFELILVDDGSPDNSGRICDEYAQKDNRIKVIHKKNGGASDARNFGLDQACGEIICFVDSDDWVNNNFLEIFVKKDADIVAQGYYKTFNDTESCFKEYYMPIEETNIESAEKFLNTIQEADNLGYLWSKAFKRNIIERYKIRFSSEYQFCEDMEFVLRNLSYCKSFAIINQGAYHYIIPNDSNKYCNINPESNFLCTISIIEKYKGITQIPNDLYTIFINRLSTFLFRMYKNPKYEINKINDYVSSFCKYNKENKDKKAQSLKSSFIYYLIGTHTPLTLHRFYRQIIRKFY